MQRDGHSRLIAVVIIGRSHASEFRRLIRQIQSSPDLQVAGQFETIEEAFSAGLAEQLSADLVVVLQAFSNEYSAADAGQLIGRMLFRRVLCCYGPWCVSDGRTHEIWPVAARVSIASAWSILEQEVRNIRNGVDALLPMAAAEEVFSHRVITKSESCPTSNEAILIVSDDRTLRETIAEMLRHTANQVFDCGTSVTRIQQAFRIVETAAVVHSRVRVLLDIDGQEDRERELRQMIRAEFPACQLIRLTSFPSAFPDDMMFDLVMDKLEVSAQFLTENSGS